MENIIILNGTCGSGKSTIAIALFIKCDNGGRYLIGAFSVTQPMHPLYYGYALPIMFCFVCQACSYGL